MFGANLGGFLVQHFAAKYPRRVLSIFLCNSFCSTASFAGKSFGIAPISYLMPHFALKKARSSPAFKVLQNPRRFAIFNSFGVISL